MGEACKFLHLEHKRGTGIAPKKGVVLRAGMRGGPLGGIYTENKLFDLDTLRVPNRSPTPILKSNDFLRQSDDIWGARGPISG